MTRLTIPARIQIALVAVLLLLPLASLPSRSEAELQQFHNRVLVKWPELGSFAQDPVRYFREASKWLSDRIGFIVEVTLLEKQLLFHVFGVAPQSTLTLGTDGYVFLHGVSASGYELFETSCVVAHSDEFVEQMRNSAILWEAFGHRRGISVHLVIVPMTPTLYADHLPKSSPIRYRQACLRPLQGSSPLEKLASDNDLSITYPLEPMKAKRDIPGFFPKGNYHPNGLSLKVIRDAYLSKLGRDTEIDETMTLRERPSELLSRYRIATPYPVYEIADSHVSRDIKAETELSEQLENLYVEPVRVAVLSNDSKSVTGVAMMLSDSLGFASAPVFASSFSRLYWVYTNGLKENSILEVIETINRVEKPDELILLFNEGGAGRIIDWSRSICEQGCK
jgi:hypothetical protein